MQKADPKSELTILRQSTGLVKDKKAKELPSLRALFDYTLSAKQLSLATVINKMKCFAVFCLDSSSLPGVSSFMRKVSACFNQLTQQLADEQLLFSATLIQMFSILFQYKIKVYQVSGGRVTLQQFGKSTFKSKIKLLLTDKNLILLKKRKLALRQGQNTFVINGNLTKEKLTSNIEDLSRLKTSDTLRTVDTQRRVTKKLNVMNYLNCNSFATKKERNSTKSSKETGPKQHPKAYKDKTIQPRVPGNSANSEKPKPDGKGKERFTGRLKFFINKKDYGFIKMKTGEEIFLHKLDLVESKINLAKFIECKQTNDMLLEFSLQSYKAKNKIYQKATEIVILETRSLL